MSLSNDHEWVVLKASLDHDAKSLAREGSLFWIVRPQLSVGGVQGLQTIMSGSFVGVRPGSGGPTNRFFGLEQAPPVKIPGPALSIVLLAPNLSSLQERSPVFYRGIQIGEVVDFQLGADSQDVVIHVRIQEPYAPLVRKNSVFWNAGGIDVNLSLLHGTSISAESAKALVSGAVEVATPDNYQEPAVEGTPFRLYEKPLPQWKEWRPSIQLRLSPAAIAPTNAAPIFLHK